MASRVLGDKDSAVDKDEELSNHKLGDIFH